MNKKKSKWFFLAAVIILIVAAGFGMWKNNHKKIKDISIIYLPKTIDVNNDFWTELISGAQTAAKEYGIQFKIEAAEKETDYEHQNLLIEEILQMQDKPDALLISPASYTESTELLKKVRKKGIKVVMIDSNTEEKVADLEVSTDNLEAGKKLGEFVAETLPAGKQVAVVGHVPNASTAIEREQGFFEGLGDRKDAFTEIVYCESEYDKAYDLTTELIEKYPDLGVIAGLNEYSAIGAARAVKDMGVQDRVTMAGIDSSLEAISMMEQGIFKGIVIQKPFKMGYQGVKYTIEMLSGKVLPDHIDAGSELVTIDNIYTRENEKLLFPFDEKQE